MLLFVIMVKCMLEMDSVCIGVLLVVMIVMVVSIWCLWLDMVCSMWWVLVVFVGLLRILLFRYIVVLDVRIGRVGRVWVMWWCIVVCVFNV